MKKIFSISLVFMLLMTTMIGCSSSNKQDYEKAPDGYYKYVDDAVKVIEKGK